MKNTFIQARSRNWVLLSVFLSQLACSSAEYVKLTVQLEIDNWDYWLMEDRRALPNATDGRGSIFTKAATVYCVIGTNTWLMEGDFYRNATVRRCFTGTNIMEESVITQALPEAEVNKIAQVSKFPGSSPPVGHKSQRVYETVDGNPGRLIRVNDLMDLRGRICWLAFCSGSALRREGRQLFPPSDLWKELISAPAGFSDTTTVFADGLGLPRNIVIFTPDQQCIFQYQVRQTTNIVGSEIPLEFYGMQYRPARTNGWELQMTFKGKVSSIGVCSELKVPELNKGETVK